MSIRAARDEDFAAIAAITNHYIATSAIHFGYEALTADELRAQRRDDHPWMVCEVDRAVVGHAKSGVWRDRSAYAWTCEVGLYVADAARGRGLGTALYAALLDECARRGFHSAVAGITLPNDASVRLHHRLGFLRIGTFREVGFKLNTWHDVEFWQRTMPR